MKNTIENMNSNYNNIPEQIIPDINDLILEQKQFVDDEYILHLHQQLGQTRELRKKAENGIKILNSHINNLKNENKSILSKINITSQKTNNKVLSLEQKRNKSREKIEHLKNLENSLKLLKIRNQNIKLERDNGLINSRKNVISRNKQKGKISKKEREDIYNIKKKYELNEQNLKKNKVEAIKRELIPKNKIKKMVEINKKEKIIKDYEDRINYEINKKKEIEEYINKMLQDENDMLERIKRINEIQKNVFHDFQKSFSEGNIFNQILNVGNDCDDDLMDYSDNNNGIMDNKNNI